MRICGLDLETTGFSPENDRIIELAYVITEHDSVRPLCVGQKYVYDAAPSDGFVSDEITSITGITNAHVEEMAQCFDSILSELESDLRTLKVQYIVAHNGENFDRPFLLKRMSAEHTEPAVAWPLLHSLPWLDTRMDIEYPPRFKSHSLTHVAAELGFLNPFPHMGISDVMTMLKVLRSFDFEKIVARSKEPWVTVRAIVTYDERDKAKARRYGWEVAGEVKYPKFWVKRLKACDLEREIKEAPFQVAVLGAVC